MFEINNVYNGFTCVKKEEIPDIKSIGYIFEHIKTKAKLVYLQNDDKNKVFSIGFRTPVSDNTGVPHIIEHSVLCGSKKFPVKEPFVELLKSSVYTFLNAMTMPDHTLFPVASMNEKDLLNLMDVYMDAVFFPNIYCKPEIFMQEGWHYELLNKKDDLSIKGVVYNEMKGVYSNPESVLFYRGMSMLYPDTTYKYEYGGLPSDIPNLTYEKFIDFHRKYYHPSNSYIFLYGDLDPDVCMKKISDEYLDRFCYSNISSKVAIQEAFNEPKEIIDSYPIGEHEDTTKKSYLSLNFSLANSFDMELIFAFKILGYYLLETPASPIKKKVMESGLCSEIYSMFEDDLIQPFMSINAIEMDSNDKDKLVDMIYEVLHDIVQNGIDYELMEATINRLEFEYRKQEDGPKGLALNFSMFKTWLYDEDPLKSLYFEKPINDIRSKFRDGYFEEIIKKYLIENNHKGIVLLNPDKELMKKNDDELKEKLKRVKFAMSDQEINNTIKNTKNLIKMQGKRDKKEDLDTIPTLTLDDLEKMPEKIDIKEDSINDIKLYNYETDTNKIAYLDFTFDTSNVKEEDIPYINLLTNLMTEVSTEKYSYEDLAKAINKFTGNLTFSAEVLSDVDNVDIYNPYICGHVEGLESNFDAFTDLFMETMLNTRFDEDDKIKEVISRLRVMMEQSFIESGNLTVTKRIMSYYSQCGKYFEKISGLDYYRFICDLDSNFENVKEVVKGKLKDIKEMVFTKNKIYVTLVASEGFLDSHKEKISNMIERLPVLKEFKSENYKIPLRALNEGIMTQSNVQYVGQGFNFKKLGYKYTGHIQVLKQILSLDYLWNEVRVKGGAYGCKLAIGVNGDFIISSYRDPNIKYTFKKYKGITRFLRTFSQNKDFYKYVVGTVGTLDKPLMPYEKGKSAEKRLIRNITYEDLVKEREEVFNTKTSDIRKYAKLAKEVLNKNVICTVGSEKKIKDEKTIFKRIVNFKE